MHLKEFFLFALRTSLTGGIRYHLWMGFLTLVMLIGAAGYFVQLRDGLVVTGMNDYVSWGLYISNLVFLVGIGAAAMMLVLPAYVLEDVDFRQAVLIANGVAVCALVMGLGFVVADLGNPFSSWHMVPVIGFLNFPGSLLAWEAVVMWVYLLLNLGIPFYLLYNRFAGRQPPKGRYLVWIYVSVFTAVGLLLVDAFLFSGLKARGYWHSALLGPRFIAASFAAGPCFMIILLYIIRSGTRYPIGNATFAKLALIATVAAQINLLMLGSEVFTELYIPSQEVDSIQYAFFGLDGYDALVRWMWMALALNVLGTAILSINRLRRNPRWLGVACILLVVSIWADHGMGLVVPAFIPTPLGEIVEYYPTWVEWTVTAGLWAMGFFILSVLVRVALPIEMGEARSPRAVAAD